MLNAQLRALYEPALDAFRATVPARPGLSEPFLVAVPEAYAAAPVRLMIVGQETFGWGDEFTGRKPSAEELMALHREFDLGHAYRSTPFWQAAHQLDAALNPAGSPAAFLWSNLVKIDLDRRRPPPDIEEEISRLGLLQAELAVCVPEVVVFFTGPRYDVRLAATFPGSELITLERGLARVRHPSLPARTFRTYHPAYLRRARRWAFLDVLADLAREA